MLNRLQQIKNQVVNDEPANDIFSNRPEFGVDDRDAEELEDINKDLYEREQMDQIEQIINQINIPVEPPSDRYFGTAPPRVHTPSTRHESLSKASRSTY